ncbi:hypothetical protein CDIK_3369 [Cucumispora dikerogammari]|nr:hypothetical protein CDIK_3369 [Cucumispora dikerogammari]
MEEDPNSWLIFLLLCNADFSYYIKQYFDLVFVPGTRILHMWGLLEAIHPSLSKEHVPKFIAFKTYFRKNYIYNACNLDSGYKPLYQPKLWSAYTDIMTNIPRTTCSVKSWHRSLNANTTLPHTNFAIFFEII